MERFVDLLTTPMISEKYGYSIRVNELRLLPEEITRNGGFHREKLKKAVINLSIDESYAEDSLRLQMRLKEKKPVLSPSMISSWETTGRRWYASWLKWGSSPIRKKIFSSPPPPISNGWPKPWPRACMKSLSIADGSLNNFPLAESRQMR